jgi:IS5 family transposase
VERWLAARLPVPGTPGLSLVEELPRHPERAETRTVVEQLNTSSPQEELVAAKEALAVAEKEVELQKHFVTVRSRDTRHGSALHP